MGDTSMTLPGRTPEPSRPDALWRSVLGTYLRAERTAQGRILTDIATEAGVSPQYLSEIERGRKEPSSEILSAVSGALGITLLDVTKGVALLLERAARPVVAVGGTHRRGARPSAVDPARGRAQLRMVS
ncbi:helix-turn-helix protein [Williamsia limnetica]|jgi:transcriptional regulator with XRE-family HTH domain|uniref:Helix-turn-helix protein n=1 Tax=Williamsia limnetica TaxID=882452 RepID=A0A318RB80_WILLI|nr:helix-turn-helix transcriptional regulator [Williamsia limnetica]PYE13075.1 helix-turn-helix protein [Williamsia limnetica]